MFELVHIAGFICLIKIFLVPGQTHLSLCSLEEHRVTICVRENLYGRGWSLWNKLSKRGPSNGCSHWFAQSSADRISHLPESTKERRRHPGSAAGAIGI